MGTGMNKHLPRLAAVAVVFLVGLTTFWQPAARVAAQALAAPTFTAAQQASGDALYRERCASCHGKNLDDGEFGPAVKGPDFRGAWFGKPADALFEKLETMPPAAPGSLTAEQHAALLAYL